MQQLVTDFARFLRQVASHWVWLMSGVVSVGISFWDRTRQIPLPNATYWTIAIFCLFVAAFLAWRDKKTSQPVADAVRALQETRSLVSIEPRIPRRRDEKFTIARVDSASVQVTDSRGSSVQLPIARITEVLYLESEPVMLVRGRLQWLTKTEVWRFFPESPTSDFGVPKVAGLNDPSASQVKTHLERTKGHVYWKRSTDVADLLSNGWELVYDQDGCYFKYPGTDYDLILITGS